MHTCWGYQTQFTCLPVRHTHMRIHMTENPIFFLLLWVKLAFRLINLAYGTLGVSPCKEIRTATHTDTSAHLKAQTDRHTMDSRTNEGRHTEQTCGNLKEKPWSHEKGGFVGSVMLWWLFFWHHLSPFVPFRGTGHCKAIPVITRHHLSHVPTDSSQGVTEWSEQTPELNLMEQVLDRHHEYGDPRGPEGSNDTGAGNNVLVFLFL